MKHKLCERLESENNKLHIYINSDIITTKNYPIVASYDGRTLAYAYKDIDVKTMDDFMAILGRDTQNWSTMDVVIHWGKNVWTFYNARNIDDFDKETIEYFDKSDYDY